MHEHPLPLPMIVTVPVVCFAGDSIPSQALLQVVILVEIILSVGGRKVVLLLVSSFWTGFHVLCPCECRSGFGVQVGISSHTLLGKGRSWKGKGFWYMRRSVWDSLLEGSLGVVSWSLFRFVLFFPFFGCNPRPVEVVYSPDRPDTMPAVQAHRSGGSSKGHEVVLDDGSSSTDSDPFVQNLFVLRHGEAGSGEGDGEGGAWDPPLTNRGKLQAWRVGRSLRMEDWNITRVVMSPFLRCVQTAAEVIAGLCLLPSSLEQGVSATAASGSVPALKASIEFGLAEVMKRQGISRPPQVAHKSSLESWTLDLPELYSLLPSEIYDTSYQLIRQTLPSYRESAADMQSRYTTTLQKIANRFHSEHILCITHGEGVMNAVSMMWPLVEISGVMYCAHTHAQRPILNSEDGPNINSGEWELLTVWIKFRNILCPFSLTYAYIIIL